MLTRPRRMSLPSSVKVEPGLTKNRGRGLYEWADSKMTLSYRKYLKGILAEEKFKEVLLECVEIAQESIKCLEIDSEESFEGFVCRAARNLILSAKQFLSLS